MRRWQNLALCVVSVALAASLACADLRRADDAFAAGNLARARSDWEELARRGFPEADYRLGRAISREQISGSATEAQLRLRNAFDRGLDKAALELGILYANPNHSLHSIEASNEWLQRAAELGSLDASRRLALHRLEGLGFRQDVSAALAELARLSALGDVESSYRIARAYETGYDGPPDFARAGTWYRTAAARGHLDAPVDLARLQFAGRGLPRDDDGAIATLETAARAGNVRAASMLGDVYADPAFAGNDPERARYWSGRADRIRQVERVPAVAVPGSASDSGWEASMNALRRQAESGNPSAALALGDLYAGRIGELPKARSEAMRWYRKGAQSGSVEAQSAFGRMMVPERSGQKVDAEALSWLESAARSGHAPAMRTLGDLHANGNVPGGGRVEAAAYFLAASRSGDSGSLRRALEIIDRLSVADTNRAYERSQSIGR